MNSFVTPTEEQVREALRRIPTPQLRRAFFERLQNPNWLDPLAAAGMFRNPPDPEATPDGLIRDTYWPEIDYLVRVAPQAPARVVDVLLGLKGTQNAWVRRAVFTIGAKIPASEAARLKPLLKSWLDSGFGGRTDPREMVNLVVNLLRGGQTKEGRWLANLLFRPGDGSSSGQPTSLLEDYWYEQGLPLVADALGVEGLQTVLPWLVVYERQISHFSDKFDASYLSRESIRTRRGRAVHDGTEQALIDAVRDLAVGATLREPRSSVSLLTRTDMILARKIALFAVAEVLGEDRSGGEPDQNLLSVAIGLLAEERSREDACRIEFAELTQAVARWSPDSLQPILDFIPAGPLVDRDTLRDRLRSDEHEAPEEVEARIDLYADRWRHRWLSAIGSQALPAALRSLLKDLDSRLGVIDAPLAVSEVTGWVGPISPLSAEEMAAMGATSLLAHLERWRSKGRGWGPEPSYEGLGRSLTSLVTTNPTILSGANDLVDRLRPIYLRAIFEGWEAALKAGLGLEWGQVAELLGHVLGHPDASDFPPDDGDWGDDADFRPAKRAAIGLLEDLVQKRPHDAVPEAAVVQFADILFTAATDDVAWEEYAANEGEGMDPLTMSLNWEWPILFRGLVHLVSHGPGTPWYDAARSALEAELEREDPRGASRAVLGESLGRLIDADPRWVMPRVPEWFGSRRGQTVAQQIALTTAMAAYHYHPSLYGVLSEAMIGAIHAREPIIAGWDTHSDPVQRIGEWVVDSIIRGHTTIADPVAREFFSVAPAKTRGQAIGHIAWAFMHATAVDDEIRTRFAELWDERVSHVRSQPEDHEELSDFHWFVKSKKFPPEWWLPRLLEAATLDSGVSTERYMIGEELAVGAAVDPATALAALKLLLAGRDEAGATSYDLTRNAVPTIIARAVESGDVAVEQEAIDFMNLLGAQGNLSLLAEVEGILSRSTSDEHRHEDEGEPPEMSGR
ncbi:MAG TPA: hypothetical protein PKD80_12515 [Microthrixaceae bacterium]|nr:hypothetical protein [Microthrixaceae bacterium]HMT24876.1 hypothetical protein [Microthrixaceae bacterium]HMT62077.1 hypothetical protein [Microthrixaceae bacterium]